MSLSISAFSSARAFGSARILRTFANFGGSQFLAPPSVDVACNSPLFLHAEERVTDSFVAADARRCVRVNARLCARMDAAGRIIVINDADFTRRDTIAEGLFQRAEMQPGAVRTLEIAIDIQRNGSVWHCQRSGPRNPWRTEQLRQKGAARIDSRICPDPITAVLCDKTRCMAIDLKGKTALVTGAGRGIGRAVAIETRAAGAKVMLNDLDRDVVFETGMMIDKEGGAVKAMPGDITAPDFPEKLVNAAVNGFGVHRHYRQ